MINILDKKALEGQFAEDFASPFFPVLADIYLSEGDLRRARKVCEVGLDHDYSNTDGKFVFARVALAEEKFTLAEKWLKQVVDENPAHFNGLRMLIRIELRLNRSQKTIRKYINRFMRFIPDDSECIELLNKLDLPNNKNEEKNPSSTPVETIANTPPPIDGPYTEKIYNIEKSMATFTMVQVLKSQQHYNQALAVLDVLQSLGQDNNKIIHERDEILQHLSESQK